MPNIYHQVLIKATPATVYAAITTQTGLARWWIANCTAKAEVGYVNEFRVEGVGVNRMQVSKLQQDALVGWLCLNKGDEWEGTKILFQFSARGENTCLDFKHLGYPSENEVYATCNYHWARHLSLLKDYCETGSSSLNPEQEKREVEKVRKGPH